MQSDVVSTWPARFGFENASARGADGTRLRLVVGGPPDAPRVILLHGAPQFSYAWRHVMTALAPRCRVVAPDLRGYGASELSSSGRYGMRELVGDLQAVEAATSRGPDDRFTLVAHDWGGPIAWAYASLGSPRLRHLIAVNAPHGDAFATELRSVRQAARSWYIALFQVPFVEHLLAARDAGFFAWMLRASSPRGTFSDDDLATYRAALTPPGRARAVLAYYRTALRELRRPSDPIQRRLHAGDPIVVQAPATILWGERDRAIAPSHPNACRKYASRLDVRLLPGVSHWVPEERPDEVCAAVVDGLARFAE